MNKPLKIYEFTVEGSGEFPFDMLRYDSCWPYSGDDAAMMGHHYRERRRVVLQSCNSGRPTVDRWRSFNWRVACIGIMREPPGKFVAQSLASTIGTKR